MKHTFSRVAITLLCAAGLSQAALAGDVKAKLAKLADGEHRSEAYKARNASRNPTETLAWFGLKPHMTVVEISPGGGWYTEILAPFLKEKGTFYAAHNNPESSSEYARKSAAKFREKLAANADIYGNVKVTVLELPDHTEAAPAGSADMVVTFRNVHSWMRRDSAEGMFKVMYSMLKPGGVLGLVTHRAGPEGAPAPKGQAGYVEQADVLKFAEAAGFKLADSSEINANPKDTKDHPGGVWSLPPNYRKVEEADKAKYTAMGESDRMTLKFMKPAE
ncbi:MAG: methyltransferase [Pseudomonadota bacterium]